MVSSWRILSRDQTSSTLLLILTMPDSPVDDLTFADSPVRSRAVRQGRRAALGQELDTGDQEDLDIGGVVDMVNPIFSRYLDISV